MAAIGNSSSGGLFRLMQGALVAVCFGAKLAVASAGGDLALKVGLTPSAFAAGGCSVQEVEAALAAMVADESTRAVLVNAQSELDEAVSNLSSLSAVVADPGTAAAHEQAVGQARVVVKEKQSALRQAQSTLREVALAAVPSASATVTRRIVKRGQSSVPAYFAAIEDGVVSWTRLIGALAIEAGCISKGESVPEVTAELLAGIRDRSDVVAAKASLETNLAAIQLLY